METNSTHGLTNSSEYGIWRNMRQRCYNPKSKYYKDYGGRGIKVCDEWKDSFEDFYQDMGPRPTINHTLDRKNNDEDYSKENCRWASPIEQQNNRSNNLYYEFDGERKTLADWCRELRVNYHRVYMRLWKGAEFEAAIDAEINLHHPPSQKRILSKEDYAEQRKLRGDKFTGYCQNAGVPWWYRNELEKKHRWHTRRELHRYMRNPEYEPMVCEDPSGDEWWYW